MDCGRGARRAPARARLATLLACILLGAPPFVAAFAGEEATAIPWPTLPSTDALDLAELALAHQASVLDAGALDAGARERMAPLLAQQARNLDAARGMLAVLDEGRGDDLATAVALAKIGTRWQAEALGLNLGAAAVPLFAHASPSEAALALAARHDATLSPEQMQDVHALDDLPEPVRGALTRLLDAHLAYDAATYEAFSRADAAALHALAEDPAAGWDEDAKDPLARAGVDLAPVLLAREALLNAARDLRDALATGNSASLAFCVPVQAPPAFSISLGTCDNFYASNFAFLLDTGGADTYHNNAGGSGFLATPSCGVSQGGTAALVDLGDGADEYGDPANPRGCGVNGGGRLGAGFLLDEAGDDVYTAGTRSTNGGGNLGSGFLLDGGGIDTYTAGDLGANGGGFGGTGFLLDLGGGDQYAAGMEGTNGGGYLGPAMLVDAGGADEYAAGGHSTNGGGGAPGGPGGVGFLLDASGDDLYDAGPGGTNGGGNLGTGFLLDGGGDDRYAAGAGGTNGGASLGVGFLVDVLGSDTYVAGDSGTNGGAFNGVGHLVDGGGDDEYIAGNAGTNGGARLGAGLLLDAGGNDDYDAGSLGTNGGARVDVPPFPEAGGVGLLFDAGGADAYFDTDPVCPGTGLDNTVIPKCTAGAQVDWPV